MKKRDNANVNCKALSNCSIGQKKNANKNNTNKYITNKNNTKLHKSKFLHIFIMPYERNMGSGGYGVVSQGKMNIEIAQAIIGYVDRKIENYKGLLVSWYGDEPLMALEIVEYLSESLISICEQHSKSYFADITTNGYLLTIDMIKELYLYKVYSYRIMIDNGDAVYDDQRSLVNGGEPFDVILHNLFDIKKHFRKDYLNIVIRLNLKGDKEDKILMKYIYLFRYIFSNDQIFDISTLVTWKNEQGDNITPKTVLVNNSVCAEDNTIFSKNRQVKSYHKLYDTFTDERWNFKGMGSGLVIGYDGKLYKCMSLNDGVKFPIGYIAKDGTFNRNKYVRVKKVK